MKVGSKWNKTWRYKACSDPLQECFQFGNLFGRKARQELGRQLLRSACERVGGERERRTDGEGRSFLGLSNVVSEQ